MKTPAHKANAELGRKVNEHLVSLGIETPMQDNYWENLSQDQSGQAKDTVRSEIAESFAHIMRVMGLDLRDDSLADTPKRVAKMFVDEIFWGLDYSNFPKGTTVENKMKYDEMVFERNITVNSQCEHHFLPIVGKAHVAYVPKNKVLGLSKLNRIVEFFSRRPQIQERLAAQIHATLCFLLETEDVAVIIEAEHMCVKTRGVEDETSDTVTSKIGGMFRSSGVAKQEMLALITAGK